MLALTDPFHQQSPGEGVRAVQGLLKTVPLLSSTWQLKPVIDFQVTTCCAQLRQAGNPISLAVFVGPRTINAGGLTMVPPP